MSEPTVLNSPGMVVLFMSKEQAKDLADLLLLYGQYLQYISPHVDHAKGERLAELKRDIAKQL